MASKSKSKRSASRRSLRTRFSSSNQPKRYGGGANRKGSDNFAAKLTEKQVVAARKLYKQGKQIKAIAERFKVAPSTMSLAVRRITFRHVKP
jgi:DNA-binding NarL/FixJ family response regulator